MQIFFYYCFTNKRGYDQICRNNQSLGAPWDIIESNWSHFLNLGEEISRSSLYSKPEYMFEITNSQFVCKILHEHTLTLIHWMVYQYYTSYRAIVWLFVANLWVYLKQLSKLKTLKKKDLSQYSSFNELQWLWKPFDHSSLIDLISTSSSKQTLVVFPSILAMRMRCSNKEYMLTGRDTATRTMKYYLDLQHGYKNILITTSANIYMDYRDLGQIILYFPDTRYYKYQHDPRVSITEVCTKLALLYWATIHEIR